jgi:hypothetical protein
MLYPSPAPRRQLVRKELYNTIWGRSGDSEMFADFLHAICSGSRRLLTARSGRFPPEQA